MINPKFNSPEGPICADLREAGALLAASADYQHSYPHSWRSKAKVIFRCTPQWFVPMDKPHAVEPVEGRARQRWDNEGGAPEPGEIVGFSPVGGTLASPPSFSCSVRLLPQGAPQVAAPDGVDRDYAVDVTSPATVRAESTRKLGEYLRDVYRTNDDRFRLFCPDETNSNRLGPVFEVSDRAWMERVEPDETLPGAVGRALARPSSERLVPLLRCDSHERYVAVVRVERIIAELADAYAAQSLPSPQS